ncbi:hypothetical protein CCACVL1_18969 [Corchorus capsularis]|uniref:Uncharacterized protein n=1 Tax=Corchorus capsularis TaxID=210143 RepID=A0A1R3HJ69_COCAP|nr:hypothetical protein CCACVL1_18969 [Corchorus capsularis]
MAAGCVWGLLFQQAAAADQERSDFVNVPSISYLVLLFMSVFLFS